MADPRLDGSHLTTTRGDHYRAAVGTLLDARGPATGAVDPLIDRPLLLVPPVRWPRMSSGGTYVLVSLQDGLRHRLRVGVNALGRARNNDLIVRPNHVSRRHCVILVHATGGCEVSDTASRNGTWVNQQRVGRAELNPGDVLSLCDQQYWVEWQGPDGQVVPSVEAAQTLLMGSAVVAG